MSPAFHVTWGLRHRVTQQLHVTVVPQYLAPCHPVSPSSSMSLCHLGSTSPGLHVTWAPCPCVTRVPCHCLSLHVTVSLWFHNNLVPCHLGSMTWDTGSVSPGLHITMCHPGSMSPGLYVIVSPSSSMSLCHLVPCHRVTVVPQYLAPCHRGSMSLAVTPCYPASGAQHQLGSVTPRHPWALCHQGSVSPCHLRSMSPGLYIIVSPGSSVSLCHLGST